MATSTIITFTGLFVVRRDPASRHYDVGILRARDAHQPHILQIEIEPDPRTGHGKWTIPPDELEQHIQNRHTRWELEVEGSSSVGVESKPDRPGDRHNPTVTNKSDLGWIINIENHEFHSGRLGRERNALQPIIRLKHGTLFSTCKTDSVDKIQGEQTEHLGFIAGGVGLNIDTSDGQAPVLNFERRGEKVEIFRLLRTDRESYKISISNTPIAGTTIVGDHFHMYYDRLFKGVPHHQRFNLKVHRGPDGEPIHPPDGDICPEVSKKDTPNPFRCGGLLVEEGDPFE